MRRSWCLRTWENTYCLNIANVRFTIPVLVVTKNRINNTHITFKLWFLKVQSLFLNTKSIISYMQYSVLMELYRTKHNKLHNEQKVILYNVLERKVICKYFGKHIAYYLPRKYSLTLVCGHAICPSREWFRGFYFNWYDYHFWQRTSRVTFWKVFSLF